MLLLTCKSVQDKTKQYVPLSLVRSEGVGQNRSRVHQLAGALQEQQQEAGGSQVLQLPGAEETAGRGALPGRAVQRHHRHTWPAIPHRLDVWTLEAHRTPVFLRHALITSTVNCYCSVTVQD